MDQIKTTQNHPAKQSALVSFLCLCFILLVFGCLYVFFPATFSWKGMAYQSVFVVYAVFYGYRVFFCSEEWFRLKQEKEARQRSDHPLPYDSFHVFLPLLVVAIFMALDIMQHFHKN